MNEQIESLRRENEVLRHALHQEERTAEGRKVYIWLLLCLIAMLAYCVAELQGCVPRSHHEPDSGDQLPY